MGTPTHKPAGAQTKDLVRKIIAEYPGIRPQQVAQRAGVSYDAARLAIWKMKKEGVVAHIRIEDVYHDNCGYLGLYVVE